VHEWRFTETPDGVHVTTIESFAGEPVEADPSGMQAVLDKSLVAWLVISGRPPSRRPDPRVAVNARNAIRCVTTELRLPLTALPSDSTLAQPAS
jgi:hypothetical protein